MHLAVRRHVDDDVAAELGLAAEPPAFGERPALGGVALLDRVPAGDVVRRGDRCRAWGTCPRRPRPGSARKCRARRRPNRGRRRACARPRARVVPSGKRPRLPEGAKKTSGLVMAARTEWPERHVRRPHLVLFPARGRRSTGGGPIRSGGERGEVVKAAPPRCGEEHEMGCPRSLIELPNASSPRPAALAAAAGARLGLGLRLAELPDPGARSSGRGPSPRRRRGSPGCPRDAAGS